MRRLGHRFDTDPERYPEVRGLLRTEELPGSDNYYHEVLTPFQLTLMSIRSAHPELNTLSIYAPGASVQLPPLPLRHSVRKRPLLCPRQIMRKTSTQSAQSKPWQYRSS